LIGLAAHSSRSLAAFGPATFPTPVTYQEHEQPKAELKSPDAMPRKPSAMPVGHLLEIWRRQLLFDDLRTSRK